MRAMLFLSLLSMLFANGVHAQSLSSSADSRLLLGLHGGMQTSVLRYTVFPYSGEFQSTADHGEVVGLTLGLPLGSALRLQLDAGWSSMVWSARHSGDPLVDINRGTRSMAEFPVLLQFLPRSLPVPFYIGAGPVLSFITGESTHFSVSHTGFSEREGWNTTRKDYSEDRLRMAVAVEAGIEAPVTRDLALQLGVRFTQPLAHTIDDASFSLRELSIWRVRLGLLCAI